MPELDPAGYRWLRSRVYALWTWLAIVDDDGHELCRLNCETDPRIARTVNDAENEIEIEVRLRGDDPEFIPRLPVRIAATVLYRDETGGEFRSRVTYTPATLSAATDGVVLTHRCHIPRSLLSEVI